MSYDLNVLCNGNRCKQYFKNGRVFIEAKEGSEYVVELKNNSWEKILAVVSVDGLNVIDGKTAEENGPGYVLDKYTSQKFYGFQYSQDKVATFKFGAMGARDSEGNPLGYAASKGDGSEKNAGVIGVIVWDEVPKPPPPPPPPVTYTTVTTTTTVWTTGSLLPNYARSASYCCNAVYSANPHTWATSALSSTPVGGLYGPGRFGYSTGDSKSQLLREAIADAKAVRATALASPKCATSAQSVNYLSNVSDECDSGLIACAAAGPVMDMASFDMETQWGQSRNYKVKETTFERREVIHRFDIYYASRESLIAMGIDLGTEKRVSFPESFKQDKYAKPPKGWRG